MVFTVTGGVQIADANCRRPSTTMATRSTFATNVASRIYGNTIPIWSRVRIVGNVLTVAIAIIQMNWCRVALRSGDQNQQPRDEGPVRADRPIANRKLT